MEKVVGQEGGVLEPYVLGKLAELHGVEPGDITPEMIEQWSHEAEFDLTPDRSIQGSEVYLSVHLGAFSMREFVETTKYVDALLGKIDG